MRIEGGTRYAKWTAEEERRLLELRAAAPVHHNTPKAPPRSPPLQPPTNPLHRRNSPLVRYPSRPPHGRVIDPARPNTGAHRGRPVPPSMGTLGPPRTPCTHIDATGTPSPPPRHEPQHPRQSRWRPRPPPPRPPPSSPSPPMRHPRTLAVKSARHSSTAPRAPRAQQRFSTRQGLLSAPNRRPNSRRQSPPDVRR